MIPSPEELLYFYTTAMTGNLTKAAHQLHLTQPALTMAIKKLESRIGASLFVRHKKGVTLAQAGINLFSHIKPLMDCWEHVKTQTLTYHHEICGKFTIGCNSATTTQLSKFLPCLLREHPKLEINVYHDVSRNIADKIIGLTVDIGIIANPVKHPDLIISRLYASEFAFFGTMNADIHKENSVIICHPNIRQTEFLVRQIKKNHDRPFRLLTVNTIESVAILTINGCGIGILPTCYTKLFPDRLKRMGKMPSSSEDVYLVYRNEQRNIPAIKIITEMIKKQLKTFDGL